MTNLAYLSIGSNINPYQNIRAALGFLAQQTIIMAVSSFWETYPVGLTAQANFLNGAAIVATQFSALALKTEVLSVIETNLGRERQMDKNAPRTIDIDLVFYNQEQHQTGKLILPNPQVLDYAFVAVPLAEIAPNYSHPITGQSLQTIASRFIADPTLISKQQIDL